MLRRKCYPFISDTIFVKWNVSEEFWELSRREIDCIHCSCMQVLMYRYIVSRQMFPFITSVWIYGLKMRGREPCLKPGIDGGTCCLELQDAVLCIHALVCSPWLFQSGVIFDSF